MSLREDFSESWESCFTGVVLSGLFFSSLGTRWKVPPAAATTEDCQSQIPQSCCEASWRNDPWTAALGWNKVSHFLGPKVWFGSLSVLQLREKLQDFLAFVQRPMLISCFFWLGCPVYSLWSLLLFIYFFSPVLDATQQYFLMRETRHKKAHSCDIVWPADFTLPAPLKVSQSISVLATSFLSAVNFGSLGLGYTATHDVITLQGTNISHPKAPLKMSFLFPFGGIC